MSDDLLAIIASGLDIFDLGRPLFAGIPKHDVHPEYRMALQLRHGDVVGADGASGATELIVTGGHVGTHVDALCHISANGRLHGGIPVDKAMSGSRFGQLGIDTMQPLVRRGLLLDVPAALGVEACTAAYEITVDDLDRALALTGCPPRPGDVILIRSGWGRHFADRVRFEGAATGTPGVGVAGARWLANFQPAAVGSDTIAFEHTVPWESLTLMPAHQILIVEGGIHIIELLDLEELAAARIHEFAFILSPLKLVGATASPARPLAVVQAARPSVHTGPRPPDEAVEEG